MDLMMTPLKNVARQALVKSGWSLSILEAGLEGKLIDRLTPILKPVNASGIVNTPLSPEELKNPYYRTLF